MNIVTDPTLWFLAGQQEQADVSLPSRDGSSNQVPALPGRAHVPAEEEHVTTCGYALK